MNRPVHPLSAGFPGVDDAQWRALAEKALRDADWESISRTTPDGIERGPLFTEAPDDAGQPGAYPFVRGATPARDPFLPWQIRQRIDHSDLKTANDAILADLNGGVSELSLHIDLTGQSGIAVQSQEDLETVLDGVMLDLAPVCLFAPGCEADAAEWLAGIASQLDQPDAFKGHFGLRWDDPDHIDQAALLRVSFPNARYFTIDASPVFEAGGTEAQELAWMATNAAGAMRALLDADFSPQEAAGLLTFSFSADTDIHLTIAKLRAARRIWARIAERFDVPVEKCSMLQHVTTSARFMSAKDPWTNLVRMTCASFGAATGGADAISVRPLSDAMDGEPVAFARRTARNIHIMLAEESHLGKTADPAGGSYTHETLSANLAERGWALFQDLERTGGPEAVLEDGSFETQIANARDARLAAYRSGEDVLIGVTKYPDPDPKALKTLPRKTRAGDPPPPPVFEPVNFAVLLENEGGAS